MTSGFGYTKLVWVLPKSGQVQVNVCQKHLFLHQLTGNALGIWTNPQVRNSMNNLLSYFGLVDARISASEKYLSVKYFF